MDASHADLQLTIGKDTVHAHRCVVASRCPALLPLPDPNDKKKKIKEKEKKVLKEGVASQHILLKMLEFIYTGKVNFPKLEPTNILDLAKAGRHFKLDRLTWLCEAYLHDNLAMDNIFQVLKAATIAEENRVKAFCMKFSLDHYNEFVTNKDGLRILDIDLFQEVVAAFQSEKKEFTDVKLGQAPPSTILEDFKRMYDTMPFADCRFSIDNKPVDCHKAILAAGSEKFAMLFKDAPPTGIELRNISTSAFHTMLKWLYYGDDHVDPLPACELVAFSRQYELGDLLRACENKIRTSIAVDTVLDILEVAYMPDIAHKQDLVEELKSKTFPFIMQHLTEIDMSPLRTMHPRIAMDILLNIQEYSRKYKKNKGR